jgi:hypothetical protein
MCACALHVPTPASVSQTFMSDSVSIPSEGERKFVFGTQCTVKYLPPRMSSSDDISWHANSNCVYSFPIFAKFDLTLDLLGRNYCVSRGMSAYCGEQKRQVGKRENSARPRRRFMPVLTTP